MRAWAVFLVLFIAACAAAAARIAPDTSNAGFKDAASVLAFVSLTAIAIERLIEGAFSVVSGRLGEWWPLRAVRGEFNAFEAATNDVLGPVTGQTIEQLSAARDLMVAAGQDVTAIQQTMDGVVAQHARLSAQLEDVRSKLPPGSARLGRLGEINAAMATTLHDAHVVGTAATGGAREALRQASEVAERASLIIATFTDNPARRVASLFLGAGLGMVVAAAVGLNLFAATLEPPAGAIDMAGLLAGKIGIVLTGVLIGLGSSPTHEVVKSLQAYKVSRTGSVGVATVSTGAGAGGGAVIDEAAIPGLAFAPAAGSGAVIRVHSVRRSS
ncbi:MAG TPA: hypothetical protein VES19_13870 [Candidatus Limnocylindrales bacterium]|nr:hypothetical protein [Candidatus Limnocylindrales bacterium]